MLKREAKKKLLDYLKANAISYKFLNEEKQPISIDSLDTIYLCTKIEHVIGEHIETCIRFREEYLYCQSYYSQPVVRNEEEAVKAARIVNYINKHLHYDCDSLYEHTFIFDEEEGDIFNGSLIRYELFEKYFYETMNHILNFSVQQVADVCVPILFYITGRMSYFEATKVGIDHALMGKP